MIVSDSARVLFVHVQKTGGLTVQELLRGSGAGRAADPGSARTALKARP